MKPASLLLAFPLLLPVCTLSAAPREIRADGQYEFLEGGKKLSYTIAKDEVYRRRPKQGANRIFLSGRKDARGMQDTARQLSDETGDQAEMVAYPTGKAHTEENRRLISSSVTLTLADGVDPMVVASAVGALSYRSLFYAPGVYAYQFRDGQTALSAAEDLKKIAGTSEVTVELACKYETKALPVFTDPYLTSTSDSKGQDFDIWYDFYNQVTMEPGIPWVEFTWMAKGSVKNYQWYLNNTGATTYDLLLAFAENGLLLPRPLGFTVGGVPIPEPPRDSYPPDIVPKFAVPNDLCIYPPFFDRYADINVLGAWSRTNVNGDPINGKDVNVAIMDDGIQMNHEELSGGLFNRTRSYNFLDHSPPYSPTNPDNFDPTPKFTAGGARDNHGTGMAGIACARANGKGIVGVAYGATLMGYRFAQNFLEPSVLADMMTWGTTRLPVPQNGKEGDEWRRNQPYFDVSINGWGQTTSGSGVVDMPNYFKKSLAYGTSMGRNGKGVVYVFPAGNEGAIHGDSNYAYTSNSIYTIHVGAVSDLGRRVIYSSPGASVHVVAPSSGGEMMPSILRGGTTGSNPSTTFLFPPDPLVIPAANTDRALGYTVSPDDYDGLKPTTPVTRARTRNSPYILTTDSATSATAGSAKDYNKNYSGTSAATAMVGGVTALMLQANPNLGWRDVQEILMRSAKVVDPLYGEWSFNPMGMPVSHKYGAGLVDADHAVAMARVWTNLGGRFGTTVSNEIMGQTQGDLGKKQINDANKEGAVYSIAAPSIRVEQVAVRVKISHTRPGDLGIILTGPAEGQADAPVESFLFIPHRENSTPDIPSDDAAYYEFTSIRHWGTFTGNNPSLRSSDTTNGGGWTLKIWDNTNYGKTGGGGLPTPPAVDVNSTKLVDGVFVDRILVPVLNSTAAGTIETASVAFHGSAEASGNLAPTINQTKIVGRPGKPLFIKMNASTDNSSVDSTVGPRAPMLGYYFKVLGSLNPSVPTIFTSPDSLRGYRVVYPDPAKDAAPNANNPSFRFDPLQGILTTVVTPDVIPNLIRIGAQGDKDAFTITVPSVEGLHPGMFADGTGIAKGAKIAPDGIDAETNVITLDKVNTNAVATAALFSDMGPSTGLKGEFTVKVTSTEDLTPGMYVLGTNTGFAARIAPNGIDARTRTITLTVANLADVNEILVFSGISFFKGPPSVVLGTGTKTQKTITVTENLEAVQLDDYVSGKGIGAGARVLNIDAATKLVTLNVPNTDTVDGPLKFSQIREFTPLEKGRWNVELSATNIFGTTRRQVVLDVRDKVVWDEWVNTFYPPITDPNADPDADGITNIWEFIAGNDPYVQDTVQMPNSAVVDGKPVLSYQVDSNADGITLTPQVSSDLINWTTAPAVAGTPVGSITPYTVTLAPTDTRKFLRLKVIY